MTKKRAVIYTRVSKEEQTTCEAQKNQAIKFCEENNIKVYKILEDRGFSASPREDVLDLWAYMKSRPSLQKLQEEIEENYKLIKQKKKANFTIIIIWKRDRLCREYTIAGAMIRYFKLKRVRIVALEDSNDPLVAGITDVLSGEEIRKLKARITLGQTQLLEKGHLLAKPPYGYKYEVLRKGKTVLSRTLKEIPRELENVKKLFRFKIKYNKEKIKNPITRLLIKTGLKKTHIIQLLSNPFFCGYARFKKKLYKHCYPVEPLVSVEEFKRVNPTFKTPEDGVDDWTPPKKRTWRND